MDVHIISRARNREAAVHAITTILDSFTIAAADDSVIRKALSLGWNDFENAVQMAAAVTGNADYLITRNVKDFQSGPVPVIQPAALLTPLDSP